MIYLYRKGYPKYMTYFNFPWNAKRQMLLNLCRTVSRAVWMKNMHSWDAWEMKNMLTGVKVALHETWWQCLTIMWPEINFDRSLTHFSLLSTKKFTINAYNNGKFWSFVFSNALILISHVDSKFLSLIIK